MPSGKRKYKVKPTVKQKAALAGILEGKTKLQAMKDAGYSAESSRSPSRNLSERRGFESLIQSVDTFSQVKYGLKSADKALEVYAEAMDANKPFGKDNFIYADHPTRIIAADRVLEVQGLRTKDGNSVNILGANIIVNTGIPRTTGQDENSINPGFSDTSATAENKL